MFYKLIWGEWFLEGQNKKYYRAICLFVAMHSSIACEEKIEVSLDQFQKALEKNLEDPVALIIPITILLSILYIFIKLLGRIFKTCIKKSTFVNARWELPEILLFCFAYLLLPVLFSVLPIPKDGIMAKFLLYWLINIISCFALIYCLIKFYKATNTTLGLKKVSLKQFVGTVLGYFCFLPNYFFSIILTLLIFITLKMNPVAQQVAKNIIQAQGFELWLGIITATIAAPVLEEILFRMFIYSGLRKNFGVTPALVISSLLFGLVHQNIFAFFPICVLGFYLAVLYERTQNIWVPILTHALHNGLTLLYMLTLVK